MKARVFVVIILILIFANCAVGGIAEDFNWPRWRGPNGDGISMETDWDPEALAGGPKILWKVDIGRGYSNVVIKGKYLYIMGSRAEEGTVYCLKVKNGKKVRRFSYPVKFKSFTTATPFIDGESVYTLSQEGHLFCFNAKNGKIRWKKDLVSELDVVRPFYEFAGSPVIEEDLVILNVNLSGIALNKNSGEMVWISEQYHPSIICNVDKDLGSYATPVLYDDNGKRFALMYHCSGLFSIEVQTGKQQWFFEFVNSGVNISDPVIFSNKVFLSTGYSNARCALVEMTENQPKELWQNENMRNEFSTAVYVDGYLYGSDGDHAQLCRFRCIDVKTGDVMWEKEMKMVSLISADGKLIILEEDGTLHIVEATPSSYQEISMGDVLEGEQKLRTFWTPPVLCKGKIYVRNYDGDLVCIDVSN
jgi:outer membrane protein assembly factor BamB